MLRDSFCIRKTAPAPTGTVPINYISEDIQSYYKKYCIIFGQPMQENKSSQAVIFVPFFT